MNQPVIAQSFHSSKTLKSISRFCFRAIIMSAFVVALTAAAQSPTNRISTTTDRPHSNCDWMLHRNCDIHMTIRDVDCGDFDVEAMAKEFSRLHVGFFSFFAAGYVPPLPTTL